MNQSINWTDADIRIENCWCASWINGSVAVRSVVLQDHQAVGESSEAQEKHGGKDLDIFHYFRNYSNKCAKRFEEPEPVEQFNPKQYDCN